MSEIGFAVNTAAGTGADVAAVDVTKIKVNLRIMLMFARNVRRLEPFNLAITMSKSENSRAKE